jgi:hypothetical protein
MTAPIFSPIASGLIRTLMFDNLIDKSLMLPSWINRQVFASVTLKFEYDRIEPG